MKPKLLNAYMKTAETFAECSTAIRLHVGAIVVKDDRIISIGYNGMPSGWDNNCEEVVNVNPSDPRYDYNNFTKELKTRPEVLHAETNAIAKVARSTNSTEDSDMFCTHAPCLDCAKLIYQAGVKTFYFRDHYRSTEGLDFLNNCGIEVYNVKNL